MNFDNIVTDFIASDDSLPQDVAVLNQLRSQGMQQRLTVHFVRSVTEQWFEAIFESTRGGTDYRAMIDSRNPPSQASDIEVNEIVNEGP